MTFETLLYGRGIGTFSGIMIGLLIGATMFAVSGGGGGQRFTAQAPTVAAITPMPPPPAPVYFCSAGVCVLGTIGQTGTTYPDSTCGGGCPPISTPGLPNPCEEGAYASLAYCDPNGNNMPVSTAGGACGAMVPSCKLPYTSGGGCYLVPLSVVCPAGYFCEPFAVPNPPNTGTCVAMSSSSFSSSAPPPSSSSSSDQGCCVSGVCTAS